MTTPLLRSTTPRTTDSVCPSWCTGHDDFYQDWEDAGEGWRMRDHTSTYFRTGGVSVARNQSEHEAPDGTRTLDLAQVTIYNENPGEADLPPHQATRLAMALIDAAETVTLHNKAQQ